MKFKSILTLAAAGLMFVACDSNNNAGSSNGLSDKATKADSLMYYFGEMRGAEFKNMAENDSTFATSEAKQAYIRGVQAGLSAVKDDQEAYNRGLFLGMQMAMNISQFKEQYDVQLPQKVFMEGLRDAMASDSVADSREMQCEFYRIMGDFQKEKEEKDKAAATESLQKAAAKQNLSKITDDLYGPAPKPGESLLKDGDKVKINLKITTEDAKPVNAPLPQEVTVGQRMQGPLNDALTSLASGQNGKFITTAQALFGQRCSQLNLKPADVITLDVTPTLVESQPAPAAPAK